MIISEIRFELRADTRSLSAKCLKHRAVTEGCKRPGLEGIPDSDQDRPAAEPAGAGEQVDAPEAQSPVAER